METYYIPIKGSKCIKHTPVDCFNEGEIVCKDCGLVMEENIIDHSAAPSYSLDGYLKQSQTGGQSKLAIHDRGLTTIMSRRNTDASGKAITGKAKSTIDRLRMWDSRSKQKHKDRSLTRAFTTLNTTGKKLGLSDSIIEGSAYVCRKAMVKNIARGRSIKELIGACIYISCRQASYPKTLDTIADSLQISRKRLSRAYRKIVFDLDMKMTVPKPSEYLNTICNKLELSEKTKRFAFEILVNLDKLEHTVNAKPNLLAASAVWYAVKKYREGVSQLDIAKIANTSAISLRKYAQDERFVAAVEILNTNQ